MNYLKKHGPKDPVGLGPASAQLEAQEKFKHRTDTSFRFLKKKAFRKGPCLDPPLEKNSIFDYFHNPPCLIFSKQGEKSRPPVEKSGGVYIRLPINGPPTGRGARHRPSRCAVSPSKACAACASAPATGARCALPPLSRAGRARRPLARLAIVRLG